MRVTRSDERRLVIEDFPWLLAVLGAALAAVLVGVAMTQVVHGWPTEGGRRVLVPLGFAAGLVAVLSLIVKRSVFDFDLVQRKLIWSRQGLWGRKGGAVPMAGIRGASVHCSRDSEGSTYSVHLSLLYGPTLPVTEYTSSWAHGQCNRIAQAINGVLEADGESAGISAAEREQALAAARLTEKVSGKGRAG